MTLKGCSVWGFGEILFWVRAFFLWGGHHAGQSSVKTFVFRNNKKNDYLIEWGVDPSSVPTKAQNTLLALCHILHGLVLKWHIKFFIGFYILHISHHPEMFYIQWRPQGEGERGSAPPEALRGGHRPPPEHLLQIWKKSPFE